MKTTLIAALTVFVLVALPPLAGAQGIDAPLAQPSPIIGEGSSRSPSPFVNTPGGAEIGVGGTRSYEQLSGPDGGIMTPNGNGTSTIMSPSGITQTVPTPR